jgi:hypothetical protein
LKAEALLFLAIYCASSGSLGSLVAERLEVYARAPLRQSRLPDAMRTPGQ